jgi:cysteine synthase
MLVLLRNYEKAYEIGAISPLDRIVGATSGNAGIS